MLNTFGPGQVESDRVALTPLKTLAGSLMFVAVASKQACPPQTWCLQRHDAALPTATFLVMALVVFSIAAAIMATTTGRWEQGLRSNLISFASENARQTENIGPRM